MGIGISVCGTEFSLDSKNKMEGKDGMWMWLWWAMELLQGVRGR